MADPASDSPKIRVLLADDCEMSRMLACAFLRKLGCEVTVASDGREACRASEGQQFDVIFMDCEMPEMGGLDATREIRRHEQASGTARVAIVALTASGRASDRASCVEAGMDDLVEKPYKREDLRLALLRHVTERVEES
jgi:CheY-like chemotaxis protein